MSSEERALWAGRPGTSPELVTRYWALAREVVKSLFRRWHVPARIEVGEVQSCLAEPLMRAVDRFDLSRGVTPRTYLARRMQWAAVDALRAANVLPRRLWQRMQEAERNFSESAMSEPKFGAERAAIRREAAARQPGSLSERVSVNEEGPMTLADMVVDRRDEAAEIEARDLVARLLEGLTAEERRTADAFMGTRDAAEAARWLGVRRSEYDGRVTVLIAKLRTAAEEEGLDG